MNRWKVKSWKQDGLSCFVMKLPVWVLNATLFCPSNIFATMSRPVSNWQISWQFIGWNCALSWDPSVINQTASCSAEKSLDHRMTQFLANIADPADSYERDYFDEIDRMWTLVLWNRPDVNISTVNLFY